MKIAYIFLNTETDAVTFNKSGNELHVIIPMCETQLLYFFINIEV